MYNLILNNYQNIKSISYNLFLYQTIIFMGDKLLCNIFNTKARWYQLHVFGNLLVTYKIFTEISNLYIDPFNSYKFLENHDATIIILCMHIHHVLFFKLNLMDYFHHIVFVALGILPSLIFVRTNQIYLGYIACSGIPGVIEYSILSLYKNNKINLITQKKINSSLYNYVRYPMCLFGSSINILAMNYNSIARSEKLYVTLYLNLLLFINGSLFNELTMTSYISNYYKNRLVKDVSYRV